MIDFDGAVAEVSESTTTYLSDQSTHIQARLRALDHGGALQRPLFGGEAFHRQLQSDVLRFIFKKENGFSITRDVMGNELRPSSSVLKRRQGPDGRMYEFEYLLTEIKAPGKPWQAWRDDLHCVCRSCGNESKNVYALLQIGLEMEFYKHDDGVFSQLGSRMNLIHDAVDITNWCTYIINHPLPAN
ncbi:hypothetical protein B0J14DRAFT_293308 [Halenospora varia]|nr:hypothetical protein B0J14DRAFT_293308 [Halenospora varia]